MSKDVYRNWASLKAHERENIDYRICVIHRVSPVAILAPHGGNIEPGTSDIARAIAESSFSLYLFEGLRRKSRELHLTSTHFDEPKCLELIRHSSAVISIHGRANADDEESIWLGGRDIALGHAISEKLKQAGYKIKTDGHSLPGADPCNICNRRSSGEGVQLELPLGLRRTLRHNDQELACFSSAVSRGVAVTVHLTPELRSQN